MARCGYNISIMPKPVENDLLRRISLKNIVQRLGHEKDDTRTCVNMSQLLLE